MKNYRVLNLLFCVIFVSGAIFHVFRQMASDDTGKELAARAAVLPKASEFSSKTGTPPHYQAYTNESGGRQAAGIAFVTTDVTPDIPGYAGPIKLMVGLDPEAVITGVAVISHSETPSYVVSLEDFLKQFTGRSVKDAFTLGKDVDGITRATISSEAIARAVERGGKKVATGILGLDAGVPAAAQPRLAVTEILLTVFIFGLAVTAAVTNNHRIRWAALLSGLFYLGFLKATMFSVVQLVNVQLGKIPSWTGHPLWYVLLGLTFLTILVWGNVYCGSVCPFAGLQDLLYKLGKNLHVEKFSVSPNLERKARYLKFIVLFSVLIMGAAIGKSDPANIEAFILFFTFHASRLGWLLVALVLVAALLDQRFWCKYLCPAGAFNGLLARLSLYKVRLDGDCGGCAACQKLCPIGAITMDAQSRPVIDDPECIVCGKCIRGCPEAGLQLTRMTHEKK